MEQRPRVALFIDAENASAQHAEDCIRYCESKGWLTIRRCYGRDASLKAWEQANAAHHILPVHTPPSAGKANASDFSLTIDVVSLLHCNRFDHAVLMSGDSDFILLAVHLREHGRTVSGIMTQKASIKLRSAFSDVLVLSDAKAGPQKPKPIVDNRIGAKSTPVAKKAPAVRQVAKRSPPARPVAGTPIDGAWLSQVFEGLAGQDGHCNYEGYKRILAKDRPGYQRGHGKADIYIQKSGLFEIRDKLLFLRAAK